MTYKVFNDIFTVTSSDLQKVFKYKNITRERLFINKFDLLPDLYFATQGEIVVKIGGVEIYKNQEGDENKLNTYSQFPIRGQVRFLDRDETLTIEIRDRDLSVPEPETIKLGISLEFDYIDLPIPSVLIPFAVAQLAQVSKRIEVFPEKNYIETSNKKYYREFDILGYRNLSFSVNAFSGTSPVLDSNSHSQPDLRMFLSDLQDGYWGNNSALTKTGSFPEDRRTDSTINFMYAEAAKFYNAEDQEINIEGDTGTFESDKAVFDLLNENKESRSYEFELLAADNFELDVSFSYVSSIARTYSESVTTGRTSGRYGVSFYIVNQDLNYRYNLKGKRVYAVVTKDLKIEGSDTPDFVEFTNLDTVEDLPDEKRTFELITTFKYIRFIIDVNYEIVIEDITPVFNINWTVSRTTPYQNPEPLPYLEIPYRELETIYNDLPPAMEYQPNRVMAWYNLVFPLYVPVPVRQYLQVTKEIQNSQLKLDFTKHIHVDEEIIKLKLGLQGKGVDDEWFNIVEDLGTISTTGKTTLDIKEFDPINPVILPRGQGVLRLVLDVLGVVKFSSLVTLS